MNKNSKISVVIPVYMAEFMIEGIIIKNRVLAKIDFG